MTCTSPIKVANGTFPCGHCLACRISKAREWSARLMHELPYWDKAVFVTLTYDSEFLPKNHSLVKKDLQLFFKRLRKSLNGRKIKYYACGEYGTKKQFKFLGKILPYLNGFGRPHYHAIIFGVGNNPADISIIKSCWRKCVWSNFQDKKAFGTVTADSCRYVSDYIFKKYSGEKAKEAYINKGVEVPFKISSQGLGLRYCLDDSTNLSNNFSFTFRGHPCGLPRYYVDKLGLTLEDQNENNFNKWKNYAERKKINLCDVAEEQDRQRRQRALTLEARTTLFHKGEL